MIGKNKERLLELCEQAVVEQDSQRLLKLIREINDLLEVKRRRLAAEAKSAKSQNQADARPCPEVTELTVREANITPYTTSRLISEWQRVGGIRKRRHKDSSALR